MVPIGSLPFVLTSHPTLRRDWQSVHKEAAWDVSFLPGTTRCRAGARAGHQLLIYKITVIATFP